jgi:hypothetical protein
LRLTYILRLICLSLTGRSATQAAHALTRAASLAASDTPHLSADVFRAHLRVISPILLEASHLRRVQGTMVLQQKARSVVLSLRRVPSSKALHAVEVSLNSCQGDPPRHETNQQYVSAAISEGWSRSYLNSSLLECGTARDVQVPGAGRLLLAQTRYTDTYLCLCNLSDGTCSTSK